MCQCGLIAINGVMVYGCCLFVWFLFVCVCGVCEVLCDDVRCFMCRFLFVSYCVMLYGMLLLCCC